MRKCICACIEVVLLHGSSCFPVLHTDRKNFLRLHPPRSEEVILSRFSSVITGTDSSQTMENNKAGRPYKSTRWECWLK